MVSMSLVGQTVRSASNMLIGCTHTACIAANRLLAGINHTKADRFLCVFLHSNSVVLLTILSVMKGDVTHPYCC